MNTITTKQIKSAIKQSGNAKLFNAVYKQLDECEFETLENIANYGIAGGFNGFIYYTDTTAFFKRNKTAILQLAYEMVADCGYTGIGQFLGSFGCLKGYSVSECEKALMFETDDTQAIQNALAWFAAEEFARFIIEHFENN
jgi:hypothetical protein